jgi:hypothetical protein
LVENGRNLFSRDIERNAPVLPRGSHFAAASTQRIPEISYH